MTGAWARQAELAQGFVGTGKEPQARCHGGSAVGTFVFTGPACIKIILKIMLDDAIVVKKKTSPAALHSVFPCDSEETKPFLGPLTASRALHSGPLCPVENFTRLQGKHVVRSGKGTLQGPGWGHADG